MWPSIEGPLRKTSKESSSSLRFRYDVRTARLSCIFMIWTFTTRSLASEVYERCAMPRIRSFSTYLFSSRRSFPASPRPISFIAAAALAPLVSLSLPSSPMSGPSR